MLLDPENWSPEAEGAIQGRAYAPISIDGPSPEMRIYLSARRELGGGDLTMQQVEAVLHALADYSLNQRMVSDAVANLSVRPLAFGTPDHPDLAHGLGRFFHGLADRLRREREQW